MDLPSLGTIDITPRSGGFLDLYTRSNQGIYEIRDYLCGTETYRPVIKGNYSDISLYIGPSTCIKVSNLVDKPISLEYHWSSGGINAFFITTIVLYLFILAMSAIIVLTGCAFGGRIGMWLYDNKIKQMLQKDICKIPMDRIPVPPPIEVRRPLPPIPSQIEYTPTAPHVYHIDT